MVCLCVCSYVCLCRIAFLPRYEYKHDGLFVRMFVRMFVSHDFLPRYEYKHDGLFIVRYSTASQLYVLSVLCKDQLLHYQIQHSNDLFFIDRLHSNL